MNETPPILLTIFNRPDKTRVLIEALRKVKPDTLFIAADGPRPDRPEDEEMCRKARRVATDIDWECDIKTHFQEENVGCGRSVSSGVQWFFEHVEQGVILEDDCIPHPHFFRFCKELFARYADDQRVMRISGLAPHGNRVSPYDYHFSRRFYCWGWGTWRRAWNHFTYDLGALDRDEFLEMVKAYYHTHMERRFWMERFDRAVCGDLTTWAIRWDIACFAQNGLSIIPEKNLITNIGCDESATHTRREEPLFSHLPAGPLEFPLRHPRFVFADGRPERKLTRALHRRLPIKNRWTQRIRHALGAMTDFYQTIP